MQHVILTVCDTIHKSVKNLNFKKFVSYIGFYGTKTLTGHAAPINFRKSRKLKKLRTI